jgi:hypothetical protein
MTLKRRVVVDYPCLPGGEALQGAAACHPALGRSKAMTCPQCNHAVPAKSLWTRAGFSSVVCPYCHASLCPTAGRAIVLFVVSFGTGDAVLELLRRNGAQLWLAFAGFFIVFVAVNAVLAPMVLRLRLKGSGSEPHLTGHKA